MPELPEVQTIASDLDEIVGGRVIEAAAVTYPKIVAGDAQAFLALVTGARIARVERLGKWIRFSLEAPRSPHPPKKRGGPTPPPNPAALLVHLKMTGQFGLGPWPAEGPWPPHAHAAFRLSGLPPERDTLFYRDMRKFGRLRAFGVADLAAFLAELDQGPDPLTVPGEEFHRRLVARRGRLKAVLLDQTVIAGLGNIYVDESLFAARLSPLRAAGTLTPDESARLLAEIRRILNLAIAARGSTTSNYQGLKGGGSFQFSHQVYGRANQPCPVCGTTIQRLVIAGRSTHLCPLCQPGLSPGPTGC